MITIPTPFLAFDWDTHENYAWGQRGWLSKENIITINHGEWSWDPDDVRVAKKWLGDRLSKELMEELAENNLDLTQWPVRETTVLAIFRDMRDYQKALSFRWSFPGLLEDPAAPKAEWAVLGTEECIGYIARPESHKIDPDRIRLCKLLTDQVKLDILAERRARGKTYATV